MFNVLVGNRDDHLRNHGFIREVSGWRLSPAFDMNPNASKLEHTLSLDGNSPVPDMDAVLDTAAFYRLSDLEAKQIVIDIRKVVATWRDEAARLNLSRPEIQRIKTVFAAAEA